MSMRDFEDMKNIVIPKEQEAFRGDEGADRKDWEGVARVTCKACLHYAVCYYHDFDGCEHFKDKSEWVHLPCKVGDIVYQVDSERIYEMKVRAVIYDTDGIAFDERAIGKSVFLTREEAEKALKERGKK